MATYRGGLAVRPRRSPGHGYADDPISETLLKRITLIDPTGTEFTVDDRAIGSTPTLNEALETETLLDLAYSDIDFELADVDGQVEDFLARAARDETWIVLLERQTGKRRPKWEIIFQGTLDIPWSIQIDRKEHVVSLQAFSLAKALERFSAEGVKRSITGVTGSVTAGLVYVTLSSTAGLAVGDEIELDDGTTAESHIIDQVLSSTQVTTAETWTNTYSSDPMTLLTPWYRYAGTRDLIGWLFDEAGITDRVLELVGDVDAGLVASDLNEAGLHPSDPVYSAVVDGGQISVAYQSQGRKLADNTNSGFQDDASWPYTYKAQGDWRPYLTEAPATVLVGGLVPDTGAGLGRPTPTRTCPAWDYINGSYWELRQTVAATSQLDLYKDNVFQETIDSFTTGTPSFEGYTGRIEHDPIADRIWISWARGDNTLTKTSHRPTSGGGWTDYYSAAGAVVAQMRADIQGAAFHINVFAVPFTQISELDPAASYAVRKTWTIPVGGHLWTLRKIGPFYVMLVDDVTGGTTRVAVFNDRLVQTDEFEISSTRATDRFLTVFGEGETEVVGVGYGGGTWFVLGRFVNAIPYADFDGLSVAGALREMALVTMTTVGIDRYGTGQVRVRLPASAVIAELPEPLEQEDVPIWESYRTSVQVTGKAEDGTDLSFIAGDTGDSALRLRIDSDLVTTAAMAETLANLYYSFFGVVRVERQVTIPEDGTIYRPLDQVLLSGKRHLVIEAELDLEDREQDLRLVELS